MVDLYGDDVIYYGVVVGFFGGMGFVFLMIFV